MLAWFSGLLLSLTALPLPGPANFPQADAAPLGSGQAASAPLESGDAVVEPTPYGQATAESAVDFQRDIRPILSDRCFSCHGPDEGGRDSDLRLDLAEEAYKDLGGYAAIVPGDVDASELIALIQSKDRKERMPPPKSGLELKPHEIELLEQWIAEGAEYTPHWSFEPVGAHFSLPGEWVDSSEQTPGDPLDAIVEDAGHKAGLTSNPPTDRATWLRRVSFGLTGLPPTPKELAAFLADSSETAFESAVDRYLDSPHFGERMAQSWLDLARYADTYGYQSDVGRRVWPYRDWVINAYNNNLPFDQFVRDQVAGDMMPGATREQKIATAFNRLHRQTNEGGSTPEEFRVEYVADRVQTFGTAFLGLTMECARCHDHRYDPISQREFYQVFAYFDDIDEFGLYSHFTSATPTPAMGLPNQTQQTQLAASEKAVRQMELEIHGNRPRLMEKLSGEDLDQRTPSATFSFGEYDEARTVASPNGRALALDGDRGERLKGAGAWNRWDPFAVRMTLKADRSHERAIVLHRSRAWTDAGSQGWQIVIEDGHLVFALIHFWPGDAIAIRSVEPLPVDEWVNLSVAYDGSSRADGMKILWDGKPVQTEILRDQLRHKITGGGPGDPLLGERFRDRGFAGGAVESIEFFDLVGNDPQQIALRDARQVRDQLLDAIPQLMVMKELPEARQAYLLDRGSYQFPSDPVDPGIVAAIQPAVAGSTRVELAEWLLDQQNPLTARVEMDRLWRTLFGYGLVRTPENFGSQGEVPAMPQLLDYLALELRDSGWDRKAMLKRLALSQTFRQSSKVNTDSMEIDPRNLLWSRGPSYPLPAEMLRDNALAGSGLMNQKIGGASAFPYQPIGLWKEKSGNTYKPSTGADLYRRSLYTYWKRTSPPPTMMIFDAAKRDVCSARRQVTNTPLQALVLWNDPQFTEAARVLAAELVDHATPMEEAFLRVAGRAPLEGEAVALRELFEQQLVVFQQNPDRAEKIRSVGASPVPSFSDDAKANPAARHAAWTLVCSALMSSDPVTMIR
jgi:hypothetical protein